MKRFGYLLGGLVAAVFALGMVGCEKEDGNGGGSSAATKLKLVASENIVAVGQPVQFTVLDGETDVTASAQIVDLATEQVVGTEFTPQEMACTQFVARVGDRETSAVKVTAYGQFDTSKSDFYKQVLVQKFTATWCGYCPQMTAALDQLDSEVPDRMVHMSVHVNDGFSIQEGERLANDFQILGIPQAVFDYAQTESYMLAKLRAALQTAQQNKPGSGIAIKSNVVKNTVCVDATLRFAEDGNYRVCCAVIEDDLYYEGGSSVDGYYHHVMRALQPTRLGEDLGARKAGEEFPCYFEIPLQEAWMSGNCEVVIYVLKMNDDKTLRVDNAAECDVIEGSADFEYESDAATE